MSALEFLAAYAGADPPMALRAALNTIAGVRPCRAQGVGRRRSTRPPCRRSPVGSTRVRALGATSPAWASVRTREFEIDFRLAQKESAVR